jgi:ABC-type uncharacterized transport system involved in gliding motility auxiliary subunit
VVPHFENVARGVVDLRDVIYFVTAGAFFLTLAGAALARERLSHARGAWRRMRLGTVGVGVTVVVVNLLGGYLRGRIDLTRDRLFTLSPATRTMVHSLKDVVQIKLYVSKELPPDAQLGLRDVRDLLSDLASASGGNVQISEADPEINPDAARDAQSYGIRPVPFSTLRGNEYVAGRGWFGLVVLYANGHRTIPLLDHTDDLEYRLASFISALTSATKPKIAYLTGFGTPLLSDFQTLQDAVSDHDDLIAIEMPGDMMALSPDSIRVAIVAAPATPLDSATIRRLNEFVNGGGSLFVLLDNMVVSSEVGQPKRIDTGLIPFLAQHGVGFGTGLVFDLASNQQVMVGNGMVANFPLWPLGLPAGQHLTTHGLKQVSFAYTAPLMIQDPAHVQALLETSPRSGVHPVEAGADLQSFRVAPGDPISQQVLAVAVDPSAGAAPGAHPAGRMIVTGDSYWLRDQFNMVRQNPANLAFAANALDWLAQDETLIRIRSKDRTPPALSFATTGGADLFKWGNLAGVPLLFVLYGVLRIVGRTTRARRRWKGSEPSTSETA